MKDVRTLLREGDPAAGDEAMSEVQAAAMRRAVLGAARRVEPVRFAWRAPVTVAAMLVLMLVVGVISGRHVPHSEPVMAPTPAAPAAVEEPRQLQFSTPGGTRIIWVFQPEFDMKETNP